MDYDAIVVGAGISGLLSALALSKEGKKVLVFEKSSFIGGNARSYDVDGYTIDTGPHAITGVHDGPLGRLLKEYTGQIPDMVYHGNYYFRTSEGLYPIPASVKDWIGFGAISNNDKINISKRITCEIIRSTMSKDTGKSVYDIIKYDKLSENALKLTDSLCYFLSGTSMKMTPAKRMLTGFSVEGINGLNIQDCCSVLKRLFIAHNVSKGQKYPLGGLGKITEHIVDSFPEDMVKIIKGSPVDEIMIEDGKATGVRSGDETYNCDFVVYTGFVKDLGKVVNEELPPEFLENINKIKQAKSYTLWLGLKEEHPMLDYKGSEVWYETGEPFWAMPTSNYDQSLAPPGKQLVAFSFIVKDSVAKTRKVAWETIISVFPGIEDLVEMEHEQVTIPEKAAITVDSFFCGPCSPFENLFLAGTDTDPRSMGLTRASHSVEEMLAVLKDRGFI